MKPLLPPPPDAETANRFILIKESAARLGRPEGAGGDHLRTLLGMIPRVDTRARLSRIAFSRKTTRIRTFHWAANTLMKLSRRAVSLVRDSDG